MATITFSVRMDEEDKRELDAFCDKMGLTTNSAINIFAKAVIREKRIPFELADRGDPHHAWVLEQLEKSRIKAGDPNTKWLSQDEVMGKYRDKYGYEV